MTRSLASRCPRGGRHHLSICSNAWSAYFSLSPGYMCKRSYFLKHQTISSHTDRAHKLKVDYFNMEMVSTLSGSPTSSFKSVDRESDLCLPVFRQVTFLISYRYVKCKRSPQTISSHTDRAHKLRVGYFNMEMVSTLSGPPTPSIKSVNRESDLCSDRSHFLNHTDPSNGASVIWCWNPWNCTRGKEDQQDENLASLATQLPQCRRGHLSH